MRDRYHSIYSLTRTPVITTLIVTGKYDGLIYCPTRPSMAVCLGIGGALFNTFSHGMRCDNMLSSSNYDPAPRRHQQQKLLSPMSYLIVPAWYCSPLLYHGLVIVFVAVPSPRRYQHLKTTCCTERERDGCYLQLVCLSSACQRLVITDWWWQCLAIRHVIICSWDTNTPCCCCLSLPALPLPPSAGSVPW